jgi:hypothetical protein
MNMKERMAYADGQPKGEVYRDKWGHLCWHRGWQTNSVGTERYPRGATLETVKSHIAAICRATKVELR